MKHFFVYIVYISVGLECCTLPRSLGLCLEHGDSFLALCGVGTVGLGLGAPQANLYHL